MNEVSKPKVVHFGKSTHLTPEQASLREVELSIAGHFREQNELLLTANEKLNERLNRLTNGVERLVIEMHGVRTGEKTEAFARIADVGASPDLPTVSAEAALLYTETASSIGLALGFQASQVGLLLGRLGLGWAGCGDYQEIGRKCSPSVSKFWHREVPARLRRSLDENEPAKLGIKSRAVLSIFRRWNERKPRLL